MTIRLTMITVWMVTLTTQVGRRPPRSRRRRGEGPGAPRTEQSWRRGRRGGRQPSSRVRQPSHQRSGMQKWKLRRNTWTSRTRFGTFGRRLACSVGAYWQNLCIGAQEEVLLRVRCWLGRSIRTEHVALYRDHIDCTSYCTCVTCPPMFGPCGGPKLFLLHIFYYPGIYLYIKKNNQTKIWNK